MRYAVVSLIVSFLVVWIGTRHFLPVLHKLNFGQAIREEGPKSHQKKSGTPTMGGLVIQLGILVAMIVFAFVVGQRVFFPLISMIAFGTIGFIDDFIKVTKKHNLGLRAWQKLAMQFVAAAAIAWHAGTDAVIGTTMIIPFSGATVDFGLWFYPFTFIAVVAMTN